MKRSILLMHLWLQPVLFIFCSNMPGVARTAQKPDLLKRMSQKLGGIIAMGSGIWTHMPLRIRTELFVISIHNNFDTFSLVLLLHRCSQMNHVSALAGKPFPAP